MGKLRCDWNWHGTGKQAWYDGTTFETHRILMPKMVDLCFEVLTTMRDRGITILLVEQDTTRALELADNVCVLASGVTVYKGAAAEVRGNETIFEKYLGIGD